MTLYPSSLSFRSSRQKKKEKKKGKKQLKSIFPKDIQISADLSRSQPITHMQGKTISLETRRHATKLSYNNIAGAEQHQL